MISQYYVGFEHTSPRNRAKSERFVRLPRSDHSDQTPILIALGYTAPEIALDSLGPLLIGKLEKTLFSMVTPETKAILSDHSNVKSVVLFGIEVS